MVKTKMEFPRPDEVDIIILKCLVKYRNFTAKEIKNEAIKLGLKELTYSKIWRSIYKLVAMDFIIVEKHRPIRLSPNTFVLNSEKRFEELAVFVGLYIKFFIEGGLYDRKQAISCDL